MTNFSDDVYGGRVSFRNTDGQGIMYHSQYLDVCEDARLEWLLNRGISQKELLEEDGILLSAVGSNNLSWKKPALLEQEISVTTEVLKIGNTSIQFRHKVFCEGDIAFEADLTMVCIEKETMKPKPVPGNIRESLERKPFLRPASRHGSELFFHP